MSTKSLKKASKKRLATNPSGEITLIDSPAFEKPWTVESEIKERPPCHGHIIKTRVSILKHKGQVVMSLEGPNSDGTLRALSDQYNAQNKPLIQHTLAFADLPEKARGRLSAKRYKHLTGPEFITTDSQP
ncbi:MAG: hypothetical protein OJI67_08615 [Prosthecobacter sp.]|nr:hypothetical protein [Prosthecobacter sp.]